MAASTIFQSLSAVFQEARGRDEISETDFRTVSETLEDAIHHAVSEYDARETISEIRNSLQQMWLENRAQPVAEVLQVLTNASRDRKFQVIILDIKSFFPGLTFFYSSMAITPWSSRDGRTCPGDYSLRPRQLCPYVYLVEVHW